MLIVSLLNITGEKEALVNLLLLNTAASSDMAHGEGNVIFLSKAAGDGNELRIISHLGFGVIPVLLQDRCERNRHKFIELPLSCGVIGPKESMKQSPGGKYDLLILIYCTLLIKLWLYWPPRVRDQPLSRCKWSNNELGLSWFSTNLNPVVFHYFKPRSI